jgi:hypothetical protein
MGGLQGGKTGDPAVPETQKGWRIGRWPFGRAGVSQPVESVFWTAWGFN